VDGNHRSVETPARLQSLQDERLCQAANAAAALGLALGVAGPPSDVPPLGQQAGVPQSIRLADCPQLQRLAWQYQGATEVTPAEALNLYERNWRHIEQDALTPNERALVHSLVASLGGRRLLV
jgi:hypothetical protein